MKRLNLILLVDDDETTNFLNKRLLTRMQIAERIEVATNGEEALRFLTESIANEHPLPDLMFLDIKMPVMDGFEFLDKYHQLPETAQKCILVMMLTSSASFYDLEKLKKYNAVEQHISKPLEEAHVREILAEHFS
ncbi:response regulator [Rufibacter tibetensis]|uniref:Response regulator receiver protein n=1 Tax=Rufibacter tibetensis TaxID=512763 RepID=A0A0P0CH79_9BACT|nr:response regulator [Rufibacter tibetensis]ALI98527.1 response regulator receiver protein [Rufibacter tibetensis]